MSRSVTIDYETLRERQARTQEKGEGATMCEHREALQKAAYELDQQKGAGIINLGKLRHMLTTATDCDHDKGNQ